MRRVITVEDWAEIRRLHGAEGVSSMLATCQKQGKAFRMFEPMRVAKT